MDDLSYMQNSLDNRRWELNQAINRRQSYLDAAGDIDVIYRRLVRDKQDMQDLRQKVQSLRSKTYSTFSGSVCNNRYKPVINSLIERYDTVIRDIDINMDRLNSKKAEYENMAYECDGLIGYLRSAVNTLVHQIENWTN